MCLSTTTFLLLQGRVLKLLHTLLTHFPTLPPRAAHFLFNNFVGIVMRYTEQPVSLSASVIQSVLGLMKMVGERGTERERETDRQTERQRKRQTESGRQRERETVREKERQRGRDKERGQEELKRF